MSEEITRIVANFAEDYCCRLDGANEALLDIIQTQVEAERERCARIIESHLIYTGPGGLDPEPIQKILAKAIRNKPEKEDK